MDIGSQMLAKCVFEAKDQNKLYKGDREENDLIGATKPMQWREFMKANGKQSHTLDIYDERYNNVGTIKFTTEIIGADVKPPAPKPAAKTHLKLTIQSATFKKDMDAHYGIQGQKQDPFIKFMYYNNVMKTDTKW